MKNWIDELFIQRSGLFLKLLNQRWSRTGELVNGMLKVLDGFGIKSGAMLDLCCGNGRISIFMAKMGFRTVGVDISKVFLEDGRRKALENGVDKQVTFLEGDVRNLKNVLGGNFEPFDVVVNAWTSIGYYSQSDDLDVFKQARQLSREGAVLLILETMHTEYLSLRFFPTSNGETDNLVMLEDRKFDPINARVRTKWSFYKRRGENLEFVDRVEFEHHIYSLSELSSLLRKAGWETVASYGNLSTLQAMSPLTSLNIAAKAI